MAVWIPARPSGPHVARYFVPISSVAADAHVPTENSGTAAVTRDSAPAIEFLVAARRDD
jgi:hypothetical protein